MTCPSLIVYDPSNDSYTKKPHLEFIPNQIMINDSKVIMFGDSYYGFYDNLHTTFEFGKFDSYITKAVIYEDVFLVFNDFQVMVGKVQPQISELHCEGD